jgi:hypothetical protein
MLKSIIRTTVLTAILIAFYTIGWHFRGHSVFTVPFGLCMLAVVCLGLAIWGYQRLRKCNWNWGTEITALLVFSVPAIWILGRIFVEIVKRLT